MSSDTYLVSVLMGSHSDWETMRHSVSTLEGFLIPVEVKVISAHRTPDLLFSYAETAFQRGIDVIIAGAGGAAHLPGMLASKTVLPVLGVPVCSSSLNGFDSLCSIVQMPQGVPVATFAIGKSGAVNAALFAVALLSRENEELRARLHAFRDVQRLSITDHPFDFEK